MFEFVELVKAYTAVRILESNIQRICFYSHAKKLNKSYEELQKQLGDFLEFDYLGKDHYLVVYANSVYAYKFRRNGKIYIKEMKNYERRDYQDFE